MMSSNSPIAARFLSCFSLNICNQAAILRAQSWLSSTQAIAHPPKATDAIRLK